MRRFAALLLVCSSCSFMLTDTLPPGYSGRTQPRCDTGGAPAVVDFVLSGVGIVGDVADAGSESLLSIVAGAAIDALFLVSGISGATETGRCERAIAAWDRKEELRARREDAARERARHEAELAAQEDQDELTDAGVVDAAGDAGP